MTAVNVLLLADRVHAFADGGYTAGGKVIWLAPKIFHLPRYDALLAWTGNHEQGRTALAWIERSGCRSLPSLLTALPSVGGMLADRPFAAIVAGVHCGATMGVALEERDRISSLGRGSQIRSMPTPETFDPEDVAGSGLAMMEDQRARHGRVHGWCQHVELGEGFYRSHILRRWADG